MRAVSAPTGSCTGAAMERALDRAGSRVRYALPRALRDTVDGTDNRSIADEAAATAAAPAEAAPLPAPAAPAAPRATVPAPADAGLDPATDDQMADDAAASGMTSRTPVAPRGE